MSTLETRELVMDVPGRADGSALDFRLEPGQIWGILGPNGAGKTTLLHTLAGLRPPRSGEIRLDGEPLSRLSRRHVARNIGLIFQEQQDGFPATVLETAMIGRHPYISPWHMESAEDIAIARRALERLDTGHLADRQINTLSGGERQRVAIATTLTQSPSIWLADEPANHLDLHHQVEVMALLAEQARAGRGVLMCLHDLNLAARWCDRILLCYPDGRLRFGPTEELLRPEVLEPLYAQPLATATVDGSTVFVPRRQKENNHHE